MQKIKRIKWTVEECRELLADKDTMTAWQLERKYRRSTQSIKIRLERLKQKGITSPKDLDTVYPNSKPSDYISLCPDYIKKSSQINPTNDDNIDSAPLRNPVQEIVDKLNILGLSGQIIINFGGK